MINVNEQFTIGERNWGIQTEQFGKFPIIEQKIYEELAKRIRNKEFVIIGAGSDEFSLQNEEDRELYYVLHYAGKNNVPILFTTDQPTESYDYFREFGYKGIEGVLAIAKAKSIQVVYLNGLWTGENSIHKFPEKAIEVFRGTISRLVHLNSKKKQYILITGGSPLLGKSELIPWKLSQEEKAKQNYYIIDRKSRIDRIADEYCQKQNIDRNTQRYYFGGPTFLNTEFQLAQDCIFVLHCLDGKYKHAHHAEHGKLFLNALNKLKSMGVIDSSFFLVHSPVEKERSLNFQELYNFVNKNSEEELSSKHYTIAVYIPKKRLS